MFNRQTPQASTFVNRLFSFLLGKSVLSRLILANTAVFLLIALSKIYDFLYNINTDFPENIPLLAYYLALPADLTQLLERPWTILSSMFVHVGFFHFLFNMIMLYFSGLILTSFIKTSKLLWIYILGGISGALFYVVLFNTFPVFEAVVSQSLAMGASAAVMSVLFAAVAYSPDYTLRLFLIGQLKLKYLALIFVFIDLLSISSENSGGHIAHLGGAMFGLIYGFFLRKNFNIKVKMPRTKRKAKMKVSRPETDDQYRSRRAKQSDRIDEILDKISVGGYNSLSKEEKEILFRHK